MHTRTFSDANDNDKLVIFLTKVLMGNVQKLNRHRTNLISAPDKYHSIHGTFPHLPNRDEFIIYRYGQALPYIKIRYKA